MPIESREDLILIKNIDIDCDEVTEEIVRRDRTQQDENGHSLISWEDVPESFDHAEYFQVKFDGHPFRLAPGTTRVMPRYLAEHFAKHLADHVLQKKERKILKETGKVTMLMNNVVERPKVLREIIVEVQQYHFESDEAAQEQLGTGSRLGQRVDEINTGREPGELPTINDTDAMPNKALGVLDKTPPPGSLEESLAKTEPDLPPANEPEQPVAEADDTKPRLDDLDSVSRQDLVNAAMDMGISVKASDNKQQIAEKLKQFT
jgi:hypothetical protein